MAFEADFITDETIRFRAIFRDWPKDDGSPGDIVEPQLIKWILYDRYWKKIVEKNIDPATKLESGYYQLFHNIEKAGIYYYEWWAGISGMPAIARKKIVIKKIIE